LRKRFLPLNTYSGEIKGLIQAKSKDLSKEYTVWLSAFHGVFLICFLAKSAAV